MSERIGPSALILSPTRELALQIEKEVRKFSYKGIKRFVVHVLVLGLITCTYTSAVTICTCTCICSVQMCLCNMIFVNMYARGKNIPVPVPYSRKFLVGAKF